MTQLHTYKLKIGSDRFLITKRLYQEIFAEINFIKDYSKSWKYVRAALSKCLNEITEVSSFDSTKIDIEL